MGDTAERTLYVTGLNAESADDDLLHELFSQVGPVELVSIRSQGVDHRYAFITYEHEESVLFACEMLDDVRLGGVPLSVRPKSGSSKEAEYKRRSQDWRNLHGKQPPTNLEMQIHATNTVNQQLQMQPNFEQTSYHQQQQQRRGYGVPMFFGGGRALPIPSDQDDRRIMRHGSEQQHQRQTNMGDRQYQHHQQQHLSRSSSAASSYRPYQGGSGSNYGGGGGFNNEQGGRGSYGGFNGRQDNGNNYRHHRQEHGGHRGSGRR